MGGKGGGETTSTVHQSNLPEYAAPYFTKMMEGAWGEMQRPYQAYPGQRLASQSPQTTAGLNMAQQYAQSGLGDLNNARSLTNMVGQRAMDLQNYEAGKVTNTYTGPQDWKTGTFAADQVGFGKGDLERMTSEEFDAADRDKYMSPYMDAVVEASQRDAQQKAMEERAMLGAQQGTTGAFGGSRAAMQTQMAANDAQRRIADIGVQGRQAAFENAQQQFERDQARAMQAAGSNQQAALQAALSNQAKNLEALGMGEQSRQFGYELGEQGRQRAAELGMNAQQQTELLRQGGKQLGLQGLQLAGQMGGQMAGFQGLSDSAIRDRIAAMTGVGQAQEEREQAGLNMGYEDWMNQLNYPRTNYNWFGALMHGIPINPSVNSSVTTPSNPIAGGLGSLMMANAMNKLGGFGQQQTG